MGMYDYIKNFEIECPHCGKIVDGFQTKDFICDLEQLDFEEIKNDLDDFISRCECIDYPSITFIVRPQCDIKIRENRNVDIYGPIDYIEKFNIYSDEEIEPKSDTFVNEGDLPIKEQIKNLSVLDKINFCIMVSSFFFGTIMILLLAFQN